MTVSFLAPSPFDRIQELAVKSRGFIAVPFIGKGASKLLPLKSGSVLVTRIDEASVRQGLVDPTEIVKFIQQGVEVHLCSNLHAKVYVFGRRAVVGSANISKSSLSLMEAAFEATDSAAVSAAKRFVLDLCADIVGEEYARSLIPLYPGERTYGPGKPREGKAEAQHSRLFVAPVTSQDWTDEVNAVHRRTRADAEKLISDRKKARLEAIWFEDRVWQKLSEGDRLVARWPNGRGFVLDPPSRIVRIEKMGSDAIIYLERPQRLKTVTSAQVRGSLKEASKHLNYPGESMRLVRNASAASAFSRLWPALSAK